MQSAHPFQQLCNQNSGNWQHKCLVTEKEALASTDGMLWPSPRCGDRASWLVANFRICLEIHPVLPR